MEKNGYIEFLFQMDELYEAVEDTLSEEFRERFDPSTLALTIALCVCMLGGLVALTFMMIAQVRAERQREMILSDEDMAAAWEAELANEGDSQDPTNLASHAVGSPIPSLTSRPQQQTGDAGSTPHFTGLPHDLHLHRSPGAPRSPVLPR